MRQALAIVITIELVWGSGCALETVGGLLTQIEVEQNVVAQTKVAARRTQRLVEGVNRIEREGRPT